MAGASIAANGLALLGSLSLLNPPAKGQELPGTGVDGTRTTLRRPEFRGLAAGPTHEMVDEAVGAFLDPSISARQKADEVGKVTVGTKEEEADAVRQVLATIIERLKNRDSAPRSYREATNRFEALTIITGKYRNADPERRLKHLLEEQIIDIQAAGQGKMETLFKAIQNAGSQGYNPTEMAEEAGNVAAIHGVPKEISGLLVAESLERFLKRIDRERHEDKRSIMAADALKTIHALDATIGTGTYERDGRIITYIENERVNGIKDELETRCNKALAYDFDSFAQLVNRGDAETLLAICERRRLGNGQIDALFTEYLRRLKTTEKNDGGSKELGERTLRAIRDNVQRISDAFRDADKYKEARDGSILNTIAHLDDRISRYAK